MKRLKILFVQPALPGPARAAWLCEPVALTSLAAMVPEHEARVLDLRVEGGSALGPALRAMRPDLVAAAPEAWELAGAREALRVARGLLGGACVTALAAPDAGAPLPDEPAVDVTMVGDPEEALRELAAHLAAGGGARDLGAIAGVRFRGEGGEVCESASRAPLDPDALPPPARHLIAGYRRRYYFAVAQPAAAMRASRGRGGERRMSAETICDRLEVIPEDFVAFLDEDFFGDALRLARLAEGLVKRDLRKYWAAQARPEDIAEQPHLALALRDAGLAAVILRFDAGEADGLEMLLDPATAARSRRAAGVLRALGIAAAGLFTVRRDLGAEDRARLGEHIRELGISWPIVRVAPRGRGANADARGQAPLPAALAAEPASVAAGISGGWEQAAWELLRRRPGLAVRALPGVARALGRSFRERAAAVAG